MSDPRFQIRPTLRQEWIRYRQHTVPSLEPRLRAGVAGAYLPRLRLEVPHEPQLQVSYSVPQCVSMVLDYYGRPMDVDWLAHLLRTDDLYGTSGRRLGWLRGWGFRVDFPSDLQFFRDGTFDLNGRLGLDGATSTRLVFRWEE